MADLVFVLHHFLISSGRGKKKSFVFPSTIVSSQLFCSLLIIFFFKKFILKFNVLV